MENILCAVDPEEKERDYDESLEGFIGNLADEEMEEEFEEWTKQVRQTMKKTTFHGAIQAIAEDLNDLSRCRAYENRLAGFAVGMAYADLVPKRKKDAENILNPIKQKLRESGLLPTGKKAA